MSEPEYRESGFTSQDGLALYYRDYGDPNSPTVPVVCLPGLTRNSKDFHDLALRLSAKRCVVCPDLRGRGRSAYDSDSANYIVPTYIRDIVQMLALAQLHKVVLIGTSLGGLISMGLAVAQPAAIAGVVLNDIGPELDPRGIARIGGYVGKTVPPVTWDEAADQLRALHGAAYPKFGEENWRKFAAQTYRDENGKLAPDYDPLIAAPFAGTTANGADMWPLFGALGPIPTVVLRGVLSDILAEQTMARMAGEKPDLITVTVPDKGHVPVLDEQESLAAIDDLLAQADRSDI